MPAVCMLSSHGLRLKTYGVVKSHHILGQLVEVSVEKKVPTVHARIEGPQPVLLSIPVKYMGLQVALLPPNDTDAAIVNRSWERTFSSVSDVLASSTLPPVREGQPLNELSVVS